MIVKRIQHENVFNQVVSENSTLVVVNLVGAEKVGSFSLKSVAILR